VNTQPGAGHFDAIRTRRFKYSEYASGEREMYDLGRDPYELQSVHNDPRYTALRASLAARLHHLVTCAGSSCRAAPTARLAVRCVRHSLYGRVFGSGIQAAVFYVNGRPVRADRRAPFAIALARRRLPARGVLRARVAFTFDRLETLDRGFKRCR